VAHFVKTLNRRRHCIATVDVVGLDYNECHTTGMCTHGHCVNLDGGFKCICDVGFTLADDGQVCIGGSVVLVHASVLGLL